MDLQVREWCVCLPLVRLPTPLLQVWLQKEGEDEHDGRVVAVLTTAVAAGDQLCVDPARSASCA